MTHLKKTGTTLPVTPEKGFRIHLLVFLLTIPATWIIWRFTGNTYPWPLWHTGGWAVGVIFHYLGIFVFKKRAINRTHVTRQQDGTSGTGPTDR
jgi:hypothetical protein